MYKENSVSMNCKDTCEDEVGWMLEVSKQPTPAPPALSSHWWLRESLFASDGKRPFYFLPCPLSQWSVFALEASRSNFSNTYFFCSVGFNVNDKNFSPFTSVSSHASDPMLVTLILLICVCQLFSSHAECCPQVALAVSIQQFPVSCIAEMNFKRIKKDKVTISKKNSMQMTLHNYT